MQALILKHAKKCRSLMTRNICSNEILRYAMTFPLVLNIKTSSLVGQMLGKGDLYFG